VNAPQLPEALRQAIEHDPSPVQPLSPVWRRTVNALAVASVVFAIAVAFFGLRSDIQIIPGWLSWGCSILEIGAAALLIGLALRESVPGRSVPLSIAVAALSAAVVYQLAVGFVTWRFSPDEVPWAADPLGHGISCMANDAALAVPTFLITLLLIFRAYPMRAWMAGLLGGVGAAIAADAITHLRCPVSDIRHVFLWHTGAVILFGLVGAFIGWLWSRRK
jgi:hypothetical protein